MVVMTLYVEAALFGELVDTFGVKDDLLELQVNILFIGKDVYDGAKFCFVDNFVVFRFASSDKDKPFAHGKQGIHGRGVGVELVEDDIG